MESLVSDQAWMSRVQRFLQDKMSKHFAAWAKSNKWTSANRKSPYRCGYSQPEWVHDLIDAMNRGDESDAKGIMLQNL